ncbi:MAG: S41 family peptidase [Alphaproteobacteria bacterium]|nr:S41 family peptidase [Alphaproteobacteria bacterium]
MENSYKWVTAFVLILFLTACTSTPPTFSTLPNDSTFPREQALGIFASAYETVSKKALNFLRVEDIAISNLQGLSELDGSLSLQDEGNILTLRKDGKNLQSFIKPEASKVEEWAETTLEIALFARETSDSIAGKEPEEIYNSMLSNMMSSLDDFSRYADPSKAQNNRAKRHGYGGVGIIVAKEIPNHRVSQTFPNGPAFNAGIHVGDLIKQVDDTPTHDLNPHDVTKLIRGPIGSKVSLKIQRNQNQQLLNFDISRKKVIRPTVMVTNNSGIVTIKISSFNKETARVLSKSIKKAVAYSTPPPKGFILDLRNNPGGLLKQSVNISDLFIAGGRLVGATGRHPLANKSYRANNIDLTKGLPLVVIVDGKSASASEIVAATLQDRGRAVVIGTTSYGKGTVQTVSRLPNGGELTLTWSRLQLPSGYFFHKLGVYPALCTSGQNIQAQDLIEKSITNGDNFASTITEWRSVGLKDFDQRKKLRGKCPAEQRMGSMEVNIATKLIEDSILYESLLSLDHHGQALLR